MGLIKSNMGHFDRQAFYIISRKRSLYRPDTTSEISRRKTETDNLHRTVLKSVFHTIKRVRERAKQIVFGRYNVRIIR